MSTSVRQVSYDLMCRMLRSVLRNGVECGPVGADGIGSIQFRASVALYGLLLDHPIDRLGRCRSCRRPGAVLGRPSRRCRVYMKAQHWLHHPDGQFLLTQLAGELRLAVAGTVATDRNTTYALPGMESEPGDPPADSRGHRLFRRFLQHQRDGRTKITTGSERLLLTPGLVVAHPRASRPVLDDRCCSLGEGRNTAKRTMGKDRDCG